MSRSLAERLQNQTLVALTISGREFPRGLLSETLIPDAWMGLVERRDGGRRFVPAGEDPRPGRDDRLLLVRNRAITVPLAVDDAPAADGHLVAAKCELLVRWQAREDDLAALGRTLLSSGRLELAELARAVCDAGALSILRRFVRERPAGELVRQDCCADLLAALRGGMQGFLFTTGLTLERVAGAGFTSASLARQEALQRESAVHVARLKSRELVEQAALAATKRRLTDLTEVLEKLRAAAALDQHLRWHDLLPALSPGERGRLLENLWRITPDRRVAQAIVVVTSRECVWLDPTDAERILQRSTPGDVLGPLRSVRFDPDRNLLLVGAARGVWTADAAGGSVKGRYAVPVAESPRTGFNAAVIAGDSLFATHSQLGAWCWPLADPERGQARFQPQAGVPRTIRGATATDDGRLFFATDNVVHLLRRADAHEELLPPAPAEILCLAAEADWVYAGTAGGELIGLNLDEPVGSPQATRRGEWTVLHRAAAPFESICPRRWDDLLELVIPCGRGISGVFAQVATGDSLWREAMVAQLVEAPAPVRRAWATDDLLVGLSELRDRLVVMRPDAPDRRGQVLPVAQMLGHTLQDACIVSRHEGTEERRHQVKHSEQEAGRPATPNTEGTAT